MILDKNLNYCLFNDVGGIRVDQKHIKNKRIFDKSFSLTPLGLLLAACGGGGGGTATSSSTTNTTSNQTTFSYSGAVVKGPLSNSLVFLDYNKMVNSHLASQRQELT